MKNIKQISAKLEKLPISELSRVTKFHIRQSGLITALDYVLGFMSTLIKGSSSLLSWAQQIGHISGNLISPQALQGKVQFRHVDFAKQLLGLVLKNQIHSQQPQLDKSGIFTAFKRVYLEDSSCFSLPAMLADFFPGSRNGHGTSATARIQLRLELFSGDYNNIDLQSFRDNDQKYAYNILGQLAPGDLVIRDMGYFVLKTFSHIAALGAFYLSRLKYGVKVYDSQGTEEIDLLKKLRSMRKQGIHVLDQEVCIGQKEKLKCRLIAIKVPQHVEQQRKRKASKDRSKSANHSKEYLEFLGWTILITNVSQQVWSAKQALDAYGCRWYIEIVFKCWKSEFKFAQYFQKKNSMIPSRALICFYLILTWLTLFYASWYHHFLMVVLNNSGRCVSPMKFAQFVKNNFERMACEQNIDDLLPEIERYCLYDKRKKTTNMMEKIYLLNFT